MSKIILRRFISFENKFVFKNMFCTNKVKTDNEDIDTKTQKNTVQVSNTEHQDDINEYKSEFEPSLDYNIEKYKEE
jgi:hypothetical protein